MLSCIIVLDMCFRGFQYPHFSKRNFLECLTLPSLLHVQINIMFLNSQKWVQRSIEKSSKFIKLCRSRRTMKKCGDSNLDKDDGVQRYCGRLDCLLNCLYHFDSCSLWVLNSFYSTLIHVYCKVAMDGCCCMIILILEFDHCMCSGCNVMRNHLQWMMIATF